MPFHYGKPIHPLEVLLSLLAQSAVRRQQLAGVSCKGCGLTYGEFKRTSQLGCSTCYFTFASLIGPLLKQIHGSAQHIGKTYKRTVRPGSATEELARMKVELKAAIDEEQYEKAAQLRDHIQKLERGEKTRKS